MPTYRNLGTERMTFNHGVEGSSPSALTNKINGLAAKYSIKFDRYLEQGSRRGSDGDNGARRFDC